MGEHMENRFDHYWYTDIREIVTLKDMLAGSADKYAKNPAFWVKTKRASHTARFPTGFFSMT